MTPEERARRAAGMRCLVVVGECGGCITCRVAAEIRGAVEEEREGWRKAGFLGSAWFLDGVPEAMTLDNWGPEEGSVIPDSAYPGERKRVVLIPVDAIRARGDK